MRLAGTPINALGQICISICRMYLALHQILASPAIGRIELDQLHEMIGRGILLDEEFYQAYEALPADWKPRLVKTPRRMASSAPAPCSLASIPCEQIHLYASMDRVYVCNFYRSVRIHLYEALLLATRIEEHSGWRFPSSIVSWTTAVEDIATEICASVPYIQGDVDALGHPTSTTLGGTWRAYSLLWPLAAVATAKAASSHSRRWAAARLRYIGEVLGIGQALVLSKWANVA
jgi:hypothetical protein